MQKKKKNLAFASWSHLATACVTSCGSCAPGRDNTARQWTCGRPLLTMTGPSALLWRRTLAGTAWHAGSPPRHDSAARQQPSTSAATHARRIWPAVPNVTTPPEIIPYYRLNHSIWSLNDNKESSR
jgi:hypothetical protein